MQNTQDFESRTEELINQILDAGAESAEVAISNEGFRDVSLRAGEVETAENAVTRRLSLRAYIGQQNASTSVSFDPNLDYRQNIQDLVTTAKASPPDPFAGIAKTDQLSEFEDRDFDQFDPTPLLTIDEMIKRGQEIERASKHKELVVDKCGFSHGHSEFFYQASNGLRFAHQNSQAAQSVLLIHKGTSQERDYAFDSKIYLDDLEAPEATARRAVERTLAGKNPVRAKSGHFPVLFDERVSSSLISHILGAMNGAAIARRASWLIDYDEAILPLDWQLIETPFRMRRLASSIIDGEGALKKESALIKDGRAAFWLSNLATARQLELPSSGHALRGGTSTSVGVSSARLDAPTSKRSQLIKDMGEGLIVTGFIGATINPHTGDYSRGVNGFWVRGGEIAEAVNETTIAGNLMAMLPTMRAADDADDDKNLMVPSLLVEEMSIAGN